MTNYVSWLGGLYVEIFGGIVGGVDNESRR